MKTFLVDNEQPCIDELAWLLRKYPSIEIAGKYTNSIKALNANKDNNPEVVFLDIDMPFMNGLELAQKIQAYNPGVIIVFVTGFGKYALDAYKAFPLDFLVKPVHEERLDETIEHLNKQYILLHGEEKKAADLKIKCFGKFDITSNSEARFPTRRVKELLLFLIGRHGTPSARNEILDALFEGKKDKNSINNLYVTLSRLRTLLDCWDEDRKLISLTEENALLIAPGVCDFTDFMEFAHKNASISSKCAIDAARVLNLCNAAYLEKETYEWTSENYYEVEEEYERIALGLSSYYAAEGRISEAETILCKLMARNDLSTDGYAALLNLYIDTDDQVSYITRYEEYARVLKKELHAKPQAIYRKHYTIVKHN